MPVAAANRPVFVFFAVCIISGGIVRPGLGSTRRPTTCDAASGSQSPPLLFDQDPLVVLSGKMSTTL